MPVLVETNLLTVYATPMLNNKYYYPKLEDLFVGYQCETRYSQSIGEFETSPSYFCQNEDGSDADCFLKHKDMIPCHPHTITGSDIKDFELSISTGSDIRYSMGIPLETIRSKKLDREDIESLGWGHFEFNYPNPKEIQSFKKGNYFLAFFTDGRVAIILQDITTNEVAADYYCNGQLYLGSCPSINELRTIERLLGI